MTVNARQALSHLVSALEVHLVAVESRRGPDDAVVDDAYEAIATAFERYEEALEVEFDESLPLVVDDADFDPEELDDPEDGDDDEVLDGEAAEILDGDDDDDFEDIVEFDLNSSDA